MRSLLELKREVITPTLQGRRPQAGLGRGILSRHQEMQIAHQDRQGVAESTKLLLKNLRRHKMLPFIYGVVRREIWYRPDMYLYRDMLHMLARNKKVDETRQVWADLKSEGVLFDQHTYGDIVRVFCDAGLIDLAMEFYEDMRSSPEPPLSLPFRVILKGLIPYPELREKIKQDFLELFPDMIVYDPPDSLSDIDDEFRF
ncbi:hypothetical protein TRIUR3_15623 [Triticum urartu]|uniref:Pentatricopeptide repeat-containing protein n=2 Tax=Triticum TaxID=4564 RepID=A0A9R0S813_TRITD|nr:hypothetical protein TRIUR3_15623 [Triticum urartu]VAH89993.1 unnamed protein product [Triticum turgidum subsp. durum]